MDQTGNYTNPADYYGQEYSWQYYPHYPPGPISYGSHSHTLGASPMDFGLMSNGAYDPRLLAYGDATSCNTQPVDNQLQSVFFVQTLTPSPSPTQYSGSGSSEYSSTSSLSSEYNKPLLIVNGHGCPTDTNLLPNQYDPMGYGQLPAQQLYEKACTMPTAILTPPYDEPKKEWILPAEMQIPLSVEGSYWPQTGHTVDAILMPPIPLAISAESKPRTKTTKATKVKRTRKPIERMKHGTQWLCDLCDRSFMRVTGLTQHNKVKHSGEKPYLCLKCGKRYADPVLLQLHVGRHTTQDKPFKCDQCPKQFFHRMDLRRHAYRHTGNAPHSCTYCPKAFARRDHLQAHEYSHQRQMARKSKTVQSGLI